MRRSVSSPPSSTTSSRERSRPGASWPSFTTPARITTTTSARPSSARRRSSASRSSSPPRSSHGSVRDAQPLPQLAELPPRLRPPRANLHQQRRPSARPRLLAEHQRVRRPRPRPDLPPGRWEHRGGDPPAAAGAADRLPYHDEYRDPIHLWIDLQHHREPALQLARVERETVLVLLLLLG